jgi:predicted DCC family thiol-disulfide oxidoreductase YuxK
MTGEERWVLVFDGECGICRRSVAWIQNRKGAERIEAVPYQHPSVPERYPELSREALEEAMHLVSPTGEVRKGARAGEEILRLLPRWRPSALVFRIPGVRWVAERVYRWVAGNRHRLGCGDHCALE